MWVPHDTRDTIVDFITYWAKRAKIPAYQLLKWLDLSASKYGNWKHRYGKANEHNGLIPRDFWLERWEQERIIDYFRNYPLEGYRRLTFMMLDDNMVAVSPSTVYRVLKNAGLMKRWAGKESKKGSNLRTKY